MANASNLVIVESPSKAKTIGKYLGPDYIVKASMGHLRDLPKSTMGVDIDRDFEPEYIPVDTKAELIAELKKASKKAIRGILRLLAAIGMMVITVLVLAAEEKASGSQCSTSSQ